MDVFAGVDQECFTKEMATHVRRLYAGETDGFSDATLAEEIRSCIARAQKYGIVLRPDVCRFVNLIFEFGRDFDQLPWAAAILRDPWLKKTERLSEAGLRLISVSGGKAGILDG